ncbi:hypothetical protein ABZ769_32045 [Streptomyces olivoreticuli]
MTTQPHNPTPAVPQQGSHFFVLTLELPGRRLTQDGTYNLAPGMTRQDAYTQIHAAVVNANPAYRRAVVAYFSLESNTI